MLGEKRRYHLVPVYHEVPLLGHKSFNPLLVLHHGSPGILQDVGRPREYTSNKISEQSVKKRIIIATHPMLDIAPMMPSLFVQTKPMRSPLAQKSLLAP